MPRSQETSSSAASALRALQLKAGLARLGGSPAWRFTGTYQWGYKSPNMGYKYSYPTYNPIYNYP